MKTFSMKPFQVDIKAEYNSDDDYIEEEEEDKSHVISESERQWKSKHCPYLDTIQRSILDFDFEKVRVG